MESPRPLRWLYLDLNSYFASVEQQLAPELRGRPVVVAAVDTDSTAAIAASYPAKAFGIRTGTPIWQAKAMCRDLVVVPARHHDYVRFHHKVIAEVQRHVPVTMVCSIDEVACRLLDNENDAAQAAALARRIKAGIAANVGEAITASIGIAPNRYLAKIAADMEKPDGLTILEAEDLVERLATLKPSDLPGVGRNMERRLAAAGLVDMRRILELDSRAARRAWGSVWGERLHWLLRGYELGDAPVQRRTIGHSQVLAPARRAPAAARLVARRLLAKAATRLRRMGWRAARLTLTVKGEERTRWSHDARLSPVQDSFALLGAFERLWEAMRARFVCESFLQVAVTLSDLSPAAAVQLGLFEAAAITPAAEERRLRLSEALDRVNRRFGRDAVTIGHDARGASRSRGPMIAFTRIPELAEFDE